MLIKPEGHLNYTVKKKEVDGEKSERQVLIMQGTQ